MPICAESFCQCTVHGWFSASIICFLGLVFRLVKVTEREPAVAYSIVIFSLSPSHYTSELEWSSGQRRSLVIWWCAVESPCMHRTVSFMLGGGGGWGRAWHERKVSVVKVFRQQQIRPNLTCHQFNGLGKEPLERWNFTSILSLGPLRRIHFHFAKYSSLLIQCSSSKKKKM